LTSDSSSSIQLPPEGYPYGWLIVGGLGLLTILMSPWWLIAFIPAFIFRYSKYRVSESRPWRKIHYPVMRLYVRAAGFAATLTNDTDSELDTVEAALILLTRKVLQLNEVDATVFVIEQFNRGTEFSDQELVHRNLIKRGFKENSQDLEDMMSAVGKMLSKDEPSIKVRLVIAGFVLIACTPDDLGEYLVELAMGNAT
jgi:hypothetical protein